MKTCLRPPALLAALLATLVLLLAPAARAGEPPRGSADPGHSHGAPLHFAHPLIAESPSPDRKLRLDGLLLDEGFEETGETYTARLELEWALAPWVSFEVDVPYTFRDPDRGSSPEALDNVELALKTASFAFAEHGLLLGGGIELVLPTGSDERGIGSNNVLEIEPFVDFGWQGGGFEVVGFLATGFLENEGDEEADFELGWNLSVLYHVHPRLQVLAELDGEEVSGGEEDGASIANLTPGLKWRPLRDRDLWIGAGLGVPITADQDFDARGIVSVFWHF